MSASPDRDGPTLETTFVVGPDLVEFDRPDLPIYAPANAALESRWADAGLDTCSHGASLDRLFGEPGAVFVTGAIVDQRQAADLSAATFAGDDPLVALGTLSDGLVLPLLEGSGDTAAPDGATIFDPGLASYAAIHLPTDDGWDAVDYLT